MSRSFFDDLDPIFFQLVQGPNTPRNLSTQRPNQNHRQAHTEVTEEEKEYVVRAELPGVQKENLDIHVGNDGRSLTIEGHVHRTNKTPSGTQSPGAQATPGQGEFAQVASVGALSNFGRLTDAPKTPEQTSTYEYRSTFTRTVGFHHPVDAKQTKAHLADGVLTLNLPKRVESGRQKISLL